MCRAVLAEKRALLEKCAFSNRGCAMFDLEVALSTHKGLLQKRLEQDLD